MRAHLAGWESKETVTTRHESCTRSYKSRNLTASHFIAKFNGVVTDLQIKPSTYTFSLYLKTLGKPLCINDFQINYSVFQVDLWLGIERLCDSVQPAILHTQQFRTTDKFHTDAQPRRVR
jgi:hypothetical protein